MFVYLLLLCFFFFFFLLDYTFNLLISAFCFSYEYNYILIQDTDELVAVKCIQTEGIEEGDLDAIEHEIRMIKGLCHPNIVQ